MPPGVYHWSSMINHVFDESTIVNHSGLTSLFECFSVLIFLPRDKADPFTFHLKLFKLTWPSLSCHGPWKGHYTACPPASLPNSLNGGSTFSHRHKDRMSDTVTEQKEPFSELNRAILSTEERQMSGERWLWNGQSQNLKYKKARLERSSDDIQRDVT